MLSLSLLTLDPRSRRVQAEIHDPYQMHRTLAKAFGDEADAQQAARCLFRVDETPHGWRVLVQSRTPPAWERLTVAPDYHLAPPHQKAFAPSLPLGQTYAFRLRANPTKREAVKPEGRRLGDRVGLYREEERLDWLTRKAAAHGFALCTVTQTSEPRPKCRAKERHAVFSAVRFDGVLRVTDPALLMEALSAGIGAGKGFGFGLLSLSPLK